MNFEYDFKEEKQFDYLVMFFENLLENKNNILDNRELYIKELFKN